MYVRKLTGLGLVSLVMSTGAAGAQDPQEALKEADRSFAAYSKEHGPRAAFLEFMAEDGIVLRASGAPLNGRAAYAEATAGKGNEGTLAWAPEMAVASDDGTLGYTWGYYVYTVPGTDGKKQETRGKYLSVWRLQKDGSWKFIADIGNIDPSAGAGKAGE